MSRHRHPLRPSYPNGRLPIIPPNIVKNTPKRWRLRTLEEARDYVGRSVTVFGPQRVLVSAVAASDVRIMQMGDCFAVLSGGDRAFVWNLYRGGAWLVVPGDVSGCLSLVRANGTR